jgi:hypothetical protein
MHGVSCVCPHVTHAYVAIFDVMVCTIAGCPCVYPASDEERLKGTQRHVLASIRS